MFSVIQKEEGEIHILNSQPFLNVHNTNTFKLVVTKGRRHMSSMENTFKLLVTKGRRHTGMSSMENTFKLLVTKGRQHMSSMEDWRCISKFVFFTDKTSKNSTGYFCSMWRSLPFQVVMETNRSCNSPVVVILSIDILVHVLLLHTNTY